MRLGTVEIILILPFLILYFLPTIIAISRRKRNSVLVILLNIFLGWTLVGWIVALVLSLSSQSNQHITVSNHFHNLNTEPKEPQKKEPQFDEKVRKLEKLKELVDSGILSQQEFEDQKKLILKN